MLQITDVNFDGTTFLIEDNNTSTCKINAADFFQWLAETQNYIHLPDSGQIVIPQIIGRWDNDRQQSYNITNTGEIYTYQGYYNYLTGMEFDELMVSYLDSVDPVWVDVYRVAPIDAQEEAYGISDGRKHFNLSLIN
jgi:hypothetical protein